MERVDLLKGFPYPDGSMDVVYSSHVLEHFTRAQGLFLLREAHRVLKPGGILRIVVPNLAASCTEYLRILSLPDEDPRKRELYEWIIIELLDQLVRTRSSGEMGVFIERLKATQNEEMAEYVRSRTQNPPWAAPMEKTFIQKLRGLTPHKCFSRMIYWYLKCIGRLIPNDIRSMVFVDTAIGERHRWMYDVYGLTQMFKDVGFIKCESLRFNESGIPEWPSDKALIG